MVRRMTTSRARPRSRHLDAAEADELAEHLEQASAQDVLAWAAEAFPGRVVLTCSWQRQSSVLVHMVATAGLDVRIVEIDTGLLFPETAETRDRLVERYGVQVETVRPLRTVEGQAEKFGPSLWERHPDRCCEMRKVEPLERVAGRGRRWVTGIRRQQSSSRATPARSSSTARAAWSRSQPLVDWTGQMVRDYGWSHDVPDPPAARAGLPVHRLLALHALRAAGRGRARGPLGRARQDRVRPARPLTRTRSHSSAAGQLDAMARPLQVGGDPVAVVALHLDGAVAQRAAGAAQALELAERALQLGLAAGQPGHERDESCRRGRPSCARRGPRRRPARRHRRAGWPRGRRRRPGSGPRRSPSSVL